MSKHASQREAMHGKQKKHAKLHSF